MDNPFATPDTHGIKVSVRPLYLPDHSNPEASEYVFAYFVRIENTGRKTAQLLTRHWHIHDSIGKDYEVAGEGVIGEQPVIGPGESYEYQSFCVLESPQGAMEGTYRFIGSDDVLFDAPIPRFELSASGSAWPAA